MSEREDVLLCRVAERRASLEDWDELEAFGGVDERVWERLAMVLRDDDLLRTAVDASLAVAERVELPPVGDGPVAADTGAPECERDVPRARRAAGGWHGWLGWAAAVAVGIAWAWQAGIGSEAASGAWAEHADARVIVQPDDRQGGVGSIDVAAAVSPPRAAEAEPGDGADRQHHGVGQGPAGSVIDPDADAGANVEMDPLGAAADEWKTTLADADGGGDAADNDVGGGAADEDLPDIVGELPKLLVSATPTVDGQQLEVLYVRRVLERSFVKHVYELGLDEVGQPVPNEVSLAKYQMPESF